MSVVRHLQQLSNDFGGCMTKADIVGKVQEKTGFAKKDSFDLVEMVFGILKGTLETGEKIRLS
jgi:integration host factor subunit alpha